LFPPSFSGRANRGLLAEATATEEAGASPATGTSEEECASTCSHAADERCEMADKKDGVGVAEMEKTESLIDA